MRCSNRKFTCPEPRVASRYQTKVTISTMPPKRSKLKTPRGGRCSFRLISSQGQTWFKGRRNTGHKREANEDNGVAVPESLAVGTIKSRVTSCLHQWSVLRDATKYAFRSRKLSTLRRFFHARDGATCVIKGNVSPLHSACPPRGIETTVVSCGARKMAVPFKRTRLTMQEKDPCTARCGSLVPSSSLS